MEIRNLIPILFSANCPAALCKRGLAKAEREDWTGAIRDYSAALESRDAPAGSADKANDQHYEFAAAFRLVS